LKGVKADIYFQPELVFEVHAQEFTLSPIYQLGRCDFGGLSLRFPSFKRIRDDKGVK
jgi:ATP-dependent DNA ligase